MNLNKTSFPRRWQLRMAAITGLFFVPACGILPTATTQPDHVFSARCPAELDRQYDTQNTPVRAQYPDDGTVRMSDFHPGGNGVSIINPIHQASVNTDASATALTESFPGIRPAVWNADEQPNPFLLASYQAETRQSSIAQTRFTASEPRQEEFCNPYTFPQMETMAAGPLPDLYPDEYVFDGGDRGLPVHYGAGERQGFETEDTIAEFSDHTGQHRVKPSNRVAVYSPRFGSVRTVDGIETDIKIDGAVGAKDAIAVGNLKLGQNAAEHMHGTGIVGIESSRRADGVETALPASAAAGAFRPDQSRKIDQGMEGRKYTNVNAFDLTDAAIVGQQMQNAVAWTRNQFPQITANTAGSNEIMATFKVQQTVGVEDNRRTKGDIRIIKLADRDVAQAGDVITFTIRFENPGDFDVYDVNIVDNLTPRLEYVADSGSIDDDNPGSLSLTPNGEGSHILTFTLDGPLKAHSTGVITFETRVR